MVDRTPEERRLIVRDDEGQWYTRRVAVIEHDLTSDEKVYRCDQHTGGPYASLADVPEVAAAIASAVEAEREAIAGQFREISRNILADRHRHPAKTRATIGQVYADAADIVESPETRLPSPPRKGGAAE